MGDDMGVNLKKPIRVAATGLAIGCLCLGFTQRGWAQGRQQMPGNSQMGQTQMGQGMPQMPSRKGAQAPDLDSGMDPMAGNMAAQRERMRNADRQKQLQLDTEKLLSLATELKEQVDKTDKNILSVDVIKKADEIEKLAKSVRERMKG
jgi:hypothetical protein